MICISGCFLLGHHQLFAQKQPVPKQELDSVYARIFVLLDESKFTEAHQLVEESIEKYKDETRFVSALYLAFSDVERVSGNVDIALTHIRKGEQVMHSVGDEYWNLKKNTVYQRLANLYYEMGLSDSAFTYAKLAISSAKKYNPDHYVNMQMQNLPIIAQYYTGKGKYALAEGIYKQIMPLNEMTDFACGNASIYEKMAEIKVYQNDKKSAVEFVERAYKMADSCEQNPYKLAAVNKTIWVYEKFNDYENVARYLKLKMSLMEETQIHEQKTKLQELETTFGTKLKEEENEALKTINEEQRIRGRAQLIAIALSVLLLVIAVLFALSYWLQKRRIAKQKEDVDRLNLLNQKIFSVISHDFKGPMMGIDVLLKVYEKYGMDQETFSNQVSLLRSDLSQANLVMDNLLNWSKMELGFSDFDNKTSDVKATADDVIGQLSASLRNKNLKVENLVPAENKLPIPPDILKIILRNLLANAIKYSHENALIFFEYNKAENKYVAKDEGIGMDEERRKNLFAGAVNSRLGTRHESGYGIGLQLVYELVNKHNGKIWVESKPNIGTSVYFSFE